MLIAKFVTNKQNMGEKCLAHVKSCELLESCQAAINKID